MGLWQLAYKVKARFTTPLLWVAVVLLLVGFFFQFDDGAYMEDESGTWISSGKGANTAIWWVCSSLIMAIVLFLVVTHAMHLKASNKPITLPVNGHPKPQSGAFTVFQNTELICRVLTLFCVLIALGVRVNDFHVGRNEGTTLTSSKIDGTSGMGSKIMLLAAIAAALTGMGCAFKHGHVGNPAVAFRSFRIP